MEVTPGEGLLRKEVLIEEAEDRGVICLFHHLERNVILFSIKRVIHSFFHHLELNVISFPLYYFLIHSLLHHLELHAHLLPHPGEP